MATIIDGKLVSNGGRVIIVVGRGKNIEEARKDAYIGIEKLSNNKLFFRKDIGWQAINF